MRHTKGSLRYHLWLVEGVAYSPLVLNRTLSDLMDLGNMDSASDESRCWITPWKHVTSFEQVTSSSDSLGRQVAGGRWRGGGAAESRRRAPTTCPLLHPIYVSHTHTHSCIQCVCRPRTCTHTYGSWLVQMKQVAQLLTRQRTNMELRSAQIYFHQNKNRPYLTRIHNSSSFYSPTASCARG